MVNKPEQVIEEWVTAGASRIIVHAEAKGDIVAAIDKLSGRVEVGVAFNMESDASDFVHNVEYKPMDYTYEMTATATDGATLDLAKGSFYLKHDEYKVSSESFKLATGSGRTKVEISLVNKRQRIHFWVNEVGVITK
jgi:hypothetical protein